MGGEGLSRGEGVGLGGRAVAWTRVAWGAGRSGKVWGVSAGFVRWGAVRAGSRFVTFSSARSLEPPSSARFCTTPSNSISPSGS